MKVLILGADGYLGWPTTMHFANEGHDVYAIDNLSKRKIESEHGVEPLNIIKPFNERIKSWNLIRLGCLSAILFSFYSGLFSF